MQSSQIPAKIPEPFANAQSSTYNNYPLADTTTVAGAASWHSGWGAINATAVSAGGIPPAIQDVNAALQQISAWGWWQAAGGPVSWDSAFSTTIGGYPLGALLRTSTYNLFYISTVDNNTTNPTAGGAGWSTIKMIPNFTPVAPQCNANGVDLTAGGGTNTTYTFTLGFTAPCAGFAHATSGFNYNITGIPNNSEVFTKVVLSGSGTSNNNNTVDGNPNSQTEFAVCTCSSGATVLATFTMTTSAVSPMAIIKQNGMLIFVPTP